MWHVLLTGLGKAPLFILVSSGTQSVRLLQLESAGNSPESRLWQVQYWRGNMYACDPPDPSQLIPEFDIVDELWQQRVKRHFRNYLTHR